MYRIIAVQANQPDKVLYEPASARETLTLYRASQKLFSTLIIQSPDGDAINGFELNQRADAERQDDKANRT